MSDANENQPPPARTEGEGTTAEADAAPTTPEEPAANAATTGAGADDNSPAENDATAAPLDAANGEPAATEKDHTADDSQQQQQAPATDAAGEEMPSSPVTADGTKPQPGGKDDEEPQPAEPQPAEQQRDADAEVEKKEDEADEAPPPLVLAKRRSESHSVQSDTSTNHRRASGVAPDPFVGLSAAERVRLGYHMAQKRFAQRRPSAGMVSTTPRDPYQPLVKSATVTPQMRRRLEVEEARKAHFAKKSGYDPSKLLPPSTFDRSKPNTDPRRSSSWTRDRTSRRPFAPSYDIVPSTRQVPTPGPGAYHDPVADYAGWS